MIADIIKTVVVAAFKLLSKIVLKVVEVLSGDLMDDINKLCPGVQNLGKVFLKFVKTLSKVWKHVKDFCKKLSNMVKKLGLKKTIEILMKKLIEKIVEKVGEIKKKFNDKFKEVTDNIKKYISEKWEELKDGVKDFVLNITSKVEDFKDKVIEKWEDVKTWTKDKVLEIGAKVADFYKAIEEKLEEAIDLSKIIGLDKKDLFLILESLNCNAPLCLLPNKSPSPLSLKSASLILNPSFS